MFRPAAVSAVVLALTGAPAGAVAVGVAAPASAKPASASVSAAPLPPVYSASSVYTVTVNGVDVPVVSYEGYDYAEFSMTAGPADVVVTKLNRTNVGAASISPLKYGITAKLRDHTAQ